jgi:hypothetical protein
MITAVEKPFDYKDEDSDVQDEMVQIVEDVEQEEFIHIENSKNLAQQSQEIVQAIDMELVVQSLESWSKYQQEHRSDDEESPSIYYSANSSGFMSNQSPKSELSSDYSMSTIGDEDLSHSDWVVLP